MVYQKKRQPVLQKVQLKQQVLLGNFQKQSVKVPAEYKITQRLLPSLVELVSHLQGLEIYLVNQPMHLEHCHLLVQHLDRT